MNSESFEYRPPLRMMVAWTSAGVVCLLFALLPWLPVLVQSVPLRAGMVLIVVWSLLAGSLGVALVYFGCSRTRLTGEIGRISRSRTFLGLTRNRKYEFDRACLVDYRLHDQRQGRKPRLWIFLRCGPKRQLLATHFDCSRITELAEWIERATGRRCTDLRRRVVRRGLTHEGYPILRAE